MIFARRSTLVHAVRFHDAEVFARIGFIGMDLATGVSYRLADDVSVPYILTRDGTKSVNDRDWIVTAPDGHIDVLTDEAFAATFIPVPTDTPVRP